MGDTGTLKVKRQTKPYKLLNNKPLRWTRPSSQGSESGAKTPQIQGLQASEGLGLRV